MDTDKLFTALREAAELAGFEDEASVDYRGGSPQQVRDEWVEYANAVAGAETPKTVSGELVVLASLTIYSFLSAKIGPKTLYQLLTGAPAKLRGYSSKAQKVMGILKFIIGPIASMNGATKNTCSAAVPEYTLGTLNPRSSPAVALMGIALTPESRTILEGDQETMLDPSGSNRKSAASSTAQSLQRQNALMTLYGRDRITKVIEKLQQSGVVEASVKVNSESPIGAMIGSVRLVRKKIFEHAASDSPHIAVHYTISQVWSALHN
eukprot:233910-Amphidinium_carterae.1